MARKQADDGWDDWDEDDSADSEAGRGFGLPQPSLALGILVSAPLFLAYEWGLPAASRVMGRNTSEMMLTRALAGLGEREHLARWALLAVVVVAAFVRVRLSGERDEVPLGASVLRTGLEGVLAALFLGPILMGLISWIDVAPLDFQLSTGELPAGPSLGVAARVLGGALWEELAFRVVVYALFYLFVLRLLTFFGAGRGAGHLGADLFAIVGSSVAFAAFHLEPFTRWLGVGGEAYDGPTFLWRLLAGVLFAGLYRWRGLAVVAWAHGLFNLAVLLGADPGVFRGGG